MIEKIIKSLYLICCISKPIEKNNRLIDSHETTIIEFTSTNLDISNLVQIENDLTHVEDYFLLLVTI
jgi:hypothetical protein